MEKYDVCLQYIKWVFGVLCVGWFDDGIVKILNVADMEGWKIAETEGWKVADTFFLGVGKLRTPIILRVGKLPTKLFLSTTLKIRLGFAMPQK